MSEADAGIGKLKRAKGETLFMFFILYCFIKFDRTIIQNTFFLFSLIFTSDAAQHND